MGDPGRPPPAASSWWASPGAGKAGLVRSAPSPAPSAHCPTARRPRRHGTRGAKRPATSARSAATAGHYLPKSTPITSHQPLPGRHRQRTRQPPPHHPRPPHPTRNTRPTHHHHPLTPPTQHHTTTPPPPAHKQPTTNRHTQTQPHQHPHETPTKERRTRPTPHGPGPPREHTTRDNPTQPTGKSG